MKMQLRHIDDHLETKRVSDENFMLTTNQDLQTIQNEKATKSELALLQEKVDRMQKIL